MNSYKRLSLEFVKKNYPVLFQMIMNNKDFNDLSVIQKEWIAGLCLEIALQSDGTPNVFLDEDEIDEEFDTIN